MRRCVCVIAVVALLLSAMPLVTIAAGPSPSAGNHERWIDRIGNLPSYAREFYTWLECNSGADGVLANPTKGTRMGNDYVYKVHEIKGTLEVVPGSTGIQIQNAIFDAVSADAQTVIDYTFEAYGAFDRDHPEVFWLNTESLCGQSLSYSVTAQTGAVSYDLDIVFYLRTADFDIRLETYRDVANLSAAIAQRDADIQRILMNCPTSHAADKIRYLNRILTETNSYNSAVGNGNSDAAAETAWKCVSALNGKSGNDGPVCEGYARAFKVLCDRLGIPCVLTEGYAQTGLTAKKELHMWNYVKLDGKWYAVDVTWNDPFISSSNAVKSGHENEAYLLVGSNTAVSGSMTFGVSHKIRNGLNSGGQQYINGPVLSANAYIDQNEPIEPKPTEPKPTEPKPTEPKPTEPKPTEPKPTEPKPTEPKPTVPTVEDYMDIAPYRQDGQYTAPQKKGFVFAGWFQDEDLTVPLDSGTTSGFAYASFVDATLLTVKCQLTEGATAASENVDLRLLTGLTSLDLHHVSFRIDDGSELIGSGVYENLQENGEQIAASEVFGDTASYFISVVMKNIPRERFDEQIVVIPGWYTLDGTFVAGTPRTIRPSDGFTT